jgi:hypothetical protein
MVQSLDQWCLSYELSNILGGFHLRFPCQYPLQRNAINRQTKTAHSLKIVGRLEICSLYVLIVV